MADSTDQGSSPGCMDRCTSFVRTRKGMILAAEILLSLVVVICYAASRSGGYSAVAICEMVFAIIFFVVFMCQFDKQFQIMHWPWSDMIRAVIGSLLYLITSLITVIRGSGDGALIAGGVFGLLAGVLFAYDAYTILPSLRKPSHAPAPTDSSEYA